MLTMLGWPQEMRDSSSRLPLQHCYGGVRIVDWPSPTNVRRLDLATLPMICEFHRNGILIDQSHFKSLESKVSAELAQVEADCWREAGRKFNPGSGDQVGQLLFEEMGQKYGSDTSPIPADEQIYHSDVPRWVAIRYGKYKYIRTLLAGEMEEIYDVEADPKELTNLALKPESKTLLADLRAKTIAELRRTSAPFADHMPPTKQMRP